MLKSWGELGKKCFKEILPGVGLQKWYLKVFLLIWAERIFFLFWVSTNGMNKINNNQITKLKAYNM